MKSRIIGFIALLSLASLARAQISINIPAPTSASAGSATIQVDPNLLQQFIQLLSSLGRHSKTKIRAFGTTITAKTRTSHHGSTTTITIKTKSSREDK